MALTNLKIRSAAIGKKLHDGGGLYLTLSARGRGKWTMRYMMKRKAKEIGLGPYPELSLADARKKHFEARILIAEGKDPLAERRNAQEKLKRDASTKFSDIAENYIKDNCAAWTNDKHIHDWRSSLRRYAYPILDEKPFVSLTTADVIRVLKPTWQSKHETTRKVQTRLKLVFGYAKAAGLYEGENPAAWQDHLCHHFPHLAFKHRIKHHRSLHYTHLPELFAGLAELETMGSKALQFMILTLGRTKEVIKVTRDEIDLKKMLWSLSAERMKAKQPHRVPLSEQAACLIESAMLAHNSPFIFHGRDPEKHISNNTMLALIKRSFKDMNTTVHGLRATCRTWGSEMTDYPFDILEFSLAHQQNEKVEAAYNRTELLEKRRPLMQDWADYATSHVTRQNTIVH